MKRRCSILIATLGLMVAAGALPVPNHPNPQVPSKAKVSERKIAPYQVGNASWYGKRFLGRPTASGEDFDMFEMTAAHRRLRLGTVVKVTNLRNGKWIIVTINDRGPYIKDRIMDLSYGAARMLELRGVERVRLDLAGPETTAFAAKPGPTLPQGFK